MDSAGNNTEQLPVCTTCRNRRVRCDREQPICGPCRKACVPCRYTHGAQVRKRGRPRRMSGKKLDDWATSASPAGPSVQQTTEQNSSLAFVHISQPLEAGNTGNRAIVRSHVMRNYKQQQRSQNIPTGGDDDIGAEIVLRATGLGKFVCTSTLRSQVPYLSFTDNDTTVDFQSHVLQEGGSAVRDCEPIPQHLPANQITGMKPSDTRVICEICRGLNSPDVQEQPEVQAIDEQQPAFRRDVLDPFDTLRTSTFRIEVRELVHHSVRTLWPSLCPLGTFDPMDKVFRPLVVSDELLFHVNLYNAGFHMSALEGKKYSMEGARQRTETIKILNQRLEDPQQAISDATIAAVTSFLAQAIVNRNIPEIQIHADGLFKMVKLAGGLEQLGGLGGLLQELVYWTELGAAVVTNTEPHFTHPTTHRRLTTLPIFTAPRCPISKMGRGFREIFPIAKPELTRPFDDLLELISQVRCLAWVLHISHSCGRPQVRLASFLARGAFLKLRISDLPNPFDVAKGKEGQGLGITGSGKHLFECLRYATLIFLEFVVAGSPPPVTASFTSSPSTFDDLSSELVKCVQKLDMHEMKVELAGFFFWIFSMGTIGASGKEATRMYFEELTARAGRWVGIGSWLEARSAWIRFLAVEVVLEGPLRGLWAELERRRVRELIVPQRLRDRTESSKGKRIGP